MDLNAREKASIQGWAREVATASGLWLAQRDPNDTDASEVVALIRQIEGAARKLQYSDELSV